MPNDVSINEKVSNLLELYATDIQTNDILLATDMSVRESKQLEIGQLLLFIESSGSFFAYAAAQANTASYVSANNVDGIVAAATNASQSISSSWANYAGSSSYAATSSLASYALSSANTNANTASFLQYTGTPNGTSSYSVTASSANAAATAYNLFYNGQPNGTSSWAVNASNAISSSYSITSSNSNTASFAILASSAITSSYATTSSIAISSNTAQTSSYLVNNGPKFLNPPITVYLSSDVTSSLLFTTFDCTAYVPAGTQTVILDGWAVNGNTNTVGFIQVRSGPPNPAYVLTAYYSHGSGDNVASGAQGCFPLSSSLSFQYSFTQPADGGITLRLVGYY
jgi:hypothetical protein